MVLMSNTITCLSCSKNRYDISEAIKFEGVSDLQEPILIGSRERLRHNAGVRCPTDQTDLGI